MEPRQGKATMVLLTPASVRCLDVSASRAFLAVVDEASVCRVYNLSTGELLFSVGLICYNCIFHQYLIELLVWWLVIELNRRLWV